MTFKITFIPMIIIFNFLDLNNMLKAYKFSENNILFTRIPYYLENEKEIKDIVEPGKKNLIFIYINLTVLFVLLAYFYNALIMLLLDAIIMMTVLPFIMQRDIDKMRAFKAKNVKDEPKKKLIDLELLNKKDDLLVKKSSYIIIGLIYLGSIALGLFLDKVYPNWIWILLGLVFLGANILIDKILSRSAIKAYTDDSKTNLLLNEKIGARQAKLLYKKSLINSLLFLLLVALMVYDPFSIIGFIIFFLGLSFNFIYTFYKYKKFSYDPILETYYGDGFDDEIEYYTAWGYKNENDDRTLVPRIAGIGADINFGKLSGKIYYGISIAIMFALTFYVSWLTNSPMTYSYEDKDGVLEISSSQLYQDEINLNDIESITILDQLPEGRMVRTNGAAMEKTSTGSYNIEGYGKVRLYIYNDVDKYIEIKTKDKNYIINEPSEEETLERARWIQSKTDGK